MAINQLIAQGIRPIGADLPQIGGLLMQKRQADAQEARQNELLKLQQGQMQRELEQQELQQIGTAIENLSSVQDPAQYQQLAQQYISHPLAQKYQIKPEEIAPQGLAGLRMRLSLAAPKPRESEPLEAIVGEDGRPTFAPRSQAVGKTPYYKPSAPLVNVNTGQEREEAKVVGGAFGQMYVDMVKVLRLQSRKLNNLDRMEALVGDVETGALTEKGVRVAQFGKSLGIDIDPNLPAKEAAISLSGQMALELRNPAGGAGMPGAMSDADRQFLQNMTPNLAQSREGRKLIIETARKTAKREQEVARMAREYRTKNGSLDEGFFQMLDSYSQENPLFIFNVKTPQEAMALPSGTTFRTPDGRVKVRP
jgi:hypothetical protein